MRIRRPIGIDLGTTNSCVGVMDDTQTKVHLYETESGSSTTPSCVWYDERTNEVLVGSDAYLRRGSTPSPVVSVKRSMGKIMPIPLGRRAKAPRNLPPLVHKSLYEGREARLRTYLDRLEAANARELEEIRNKKRNDPPLMWVMDQDKRLEIYLERLDDQQLRHQMEKDPPLLWLPEEISALILAEERRQILQLQQGREPENEHVVDRCVITVPAYFGSEQTEATKEAGRLAGLEVLDLLQEPSAAAIYYCWKANIKDGLFLVFDLGGGTFDVSVLRLQNGLPQVLGVSGDNLLGGDDFDKALAEHIRATLARENPRYDLELQLQRPEDRRISEGLIFLAESVKKALTRDATYLLRDTGVCDRTGARLNIDMKITRAQFEALIAPIVAKCVPKCWEAVARTKLKADLSLADVDRIFLVGGATHVPFVQREVRRRFCRGRDATLWTASEIETVVGAISGDDAEQTDALREKARAMMSRQERARCDEPMIDSPDLCVALGAAVQAAAKGVEVQGAQANIVVTSPRSTAAESVTIAGKVIASAGVGLGGATLSLRGDEFVDMRQELKAGGDFAFPQVPLSRVGENSFMLALESAQGQEIAESAVVIARVEDGSVHAMRVDTPPVVSRPYKLDVMRHGVVSRIVLVESGASLPVDRRTFELGVPDPNTGVILFKVFQGNRLLKTIEAFIAPEIPPGTRITFTFSVGRDHMMRATYQFSGEKEEHPVIIEPPDSLKPKPRDLEDVRGAIAQELDSLDEIKRETFQIRFEALDHGIKDAAEKADEAKLIDRYEQLQGLRDEIQRANVRLKPAWHETQRVFETCVQLLGAIKAKQPDYADADVRQNLTATRDAAHKAFQEKQQDRYSVHCEGLNKTQDALYRDLHRINVTVVPPLQRARKMIEGGLTDSKELGQQADQILRRLEEKQRSEADRQAREALGNHILQCRQARDKVDTCIQGFQELKGTYTADPDGAMDKCHGYFPILNNARVVLDQKQSILDGKVVRTDESLPTATGGN